MVRFFRRSIEMVVGLVVGLFFTVILPVLALLPLLISFTYLWEVCLEWPRWIASIAVILLILGSGMVFFIAACVAVVAGLIQGFWLASLLMVAVALVWPFLIGSGISLFSSAASLRTQ